jgi:Undecaprenyl-phosphate glucose phosphotransferase
MHGKLEKIPAKASQNIRFTSNVLRTLGVINDIFCLAIAFLLARTAYDVIIGYYYDVSFHITGVIILSINYLLLKVSRDRYTAFKGQGEDVGGSSLMEFFLAACLTGLVIIQLGMLPEFSRGFGLFFVGFGLIVLFLGHIGFRRLIWILMDRGILGQRVAIYASTVDIVKRVIKLLDMERLPHLRLIGYADDRRRAAGNQVGAVPYIGGFDALVELAQAGELDQVILALPDVQEERLKSIAELLSSASIDLCLLPSETIEMSTRYRVNFLGSLPVLAIWQQPIRDIDGILKELLDRGIAIFAIGMLLPFLLLVALLIRIESKGPIIFRQKRFGFNNNEISVLKFRSMYVDRQDVSGAQRTQKNDPRITRIGRIIRRTSIDELPQLFNVLRGDMSLVGPRPHATQMRVGDKYYFDAVQGYAARHRVKPGITGLAQVRGLRGEIDTVERARKRVEYDIYYIENWSPLLDIRIILETVFKLIWDKNAY